MNTEKLLRRTYAGQKYPHICILSISTDKNQSMKVRDTLYIPTYEYNYKVITEYDVILQGYYITDKRKSENTRKYTSMNSIKNSHKLHMETREPTRGPRRKGLETVCR